MKVSFVNSVNYKSNFKSRFEPTTYLQSAFDKAIDSCDKKADRASVNFLNNVKNILSDGKDDVIKIYEKPNSEINLGMSRPHNLSVNGKLVRKNAVCSAPISDGEQCIAAINKFAIDRGLSKQDSSVGVGLENKIKEVKTYLDALEMAYAHVVRNELKDLKGKIFKDI